MHYFLVLVSTFFPFRPKKPLCFQEVMLKNSLHLCNELPDPKCYREAETVALDRG